MRALTFNCKRQFLTLTPHIIASNGQLKQESWLKKFPKLGVRGGFVEPFVKLNVQKALLGELFCFFLDIKFIPLLEFDELLLKRHT
jgi:hypothetical protein